jgi:DNA invertase Pin-like site-specific DNA recombinase
VNPAHLFVGTQLDNVADMIAKGRRPRGAHEGLRNGRALITPDDVREIRRRYAAGEFQSSIARDFPIGKTQVAAIASRKSWWCVE